MLLLSLMYAANIGGTGTIIGTPPNLITIGVLEDTFGPDADTGINFASWMGFTMPGKTDLEWTNSLLPADVCIFELSKWFRFYRLSNVL